MGTYLRKVKDDDPNAKETFVYIEYDPATAGITWLGEPMTEAEAREDLRCAGMSDHEIEAKIQQARANPM